MGRLQNHMKQNNSWSLCSSIPMPACVCAAQPRTAPAPETPLHTNYTPAMTCCSTDDPPTTHIRPTDTVEALSHLTDTTDSGAVLQYNSLCRKNSRPTDNACKTTSLAIFKKRASNMAERRQYCKLTLRKRWPWSLLVVERAGTECLAVVACGAVCECRVTL